MSASTYAPVIDGYSGFPIETRPAHGLTPGTIEWLLDAVERHAIAEQDALQHYEFIGTASSDPVIALVMRLILEDEQRHHGLLKRIEASLRDALNWTQSSNALPVSGTPRQPPARELADMTRALITEEHGGARAIRDLAHRERQIDAGLHTLLLEMMAMDSDKHARVLQFVERRLAARGRAKGGAVE
jgi:hypothetical protein